MLQYLIIQLDETSSSYCHYSNPSVKRKLICLDDLKKGIKFSMKENLNVQFLYPNYKIPEEYREIIESIDHIKMGPLECEENLDVIVIDTPHLETDLANCVIWRCSLQDLVSQIEGVVQLMKKTSRLNVILTDILDWDKTDFKDYESALLRIGEGVIDIYKSKGRVEINLLTDRVMLDSMNNCNAGETNLTLAPNGKFYVCPAFYFENPSDSVGSLKNGIHIANAQLYRLDHAPLCRSCDAFQCKRCIWMNQKSTLDCNTPSHEQCVSAHIERNISRMLRQELLELGINFNNSKEIDIIDYLDPFNKQEHGD